MIVNHRYKFIFIHIPKTGGMTARKFFHENKIANHAKNEGLAEFATYTQDGVVYRTPLHFPIGFSEKNYSTEYNTYYKFSFIRNPYERFISSFFYKVINVEGNSEKYFNGLDVAATKNYIKQYYIPKIEDKKNTIQVAIPQHKFVCDKNDQIVVNKLGLTKNIIVELEQIVKQLQLPIATPLNIVSKNVGYEPIFDKKLLLDEEIKNWVYNFYRKDFDIFNFPKEYPVQ